MQTILRLSNGLTLLFLLACLASCAQPVAVKTKTKTVYVEKIVPVPSAMTAYDEGLPYPPDPVSNDDQTRYIQSLQAAVHFDVCQLINVSHLTIASDKLNCVKTPTGAKP